MKSIIIIPARYNSTRFPGKPLAMIAGKTLLQHTCASAQLAVAHFPDTELLVATDDDRILAHCEAINVPATKTPISCPTGTDRVWAAIEQLTSPPDIVVNLQGDAPFTPAYFITALLNKLQSNTDVSIVTAVTQLSWTELDNLRLAKQSTSFSGTTAVIDKQEQALWFSKNIIPALRNENELRENNALSPVYRHIGLYAYRREMLATYVKLAQTPYEQLEGLEQLRLLEHGYTIHTVKVAYGQDYFLSGVDTLEDAQRAAQWIQEHGDNVKE